MDSLSVKLLQKGKQAIQRQPFLHNAKLPTSIPTAKHPSVSNREFENIYNKMPQSPTDSPTDFFDANTDRIFPSVNCRSDILPTEIPTDRAISKVCELPTESSTDDEKY